MRVAYGVGPVVAAAVIGDVATISGLPTCDRFAAYSGRPPSKRPPATG
jgi:hypothetical protein